MACNFQETCLAEKAERAWASLGDGKWLGIMLCDGCYDVMDCTSVTVTREPPTEQWMKQLYDGMTGEDNEEELV